MWRQHPQRQKWWKEEDNDDERWWRQWLEITHHLESFSDAWKDKEKCEEQVNKYYMHIGNAETLLHLTYNRYTTYLHLLPVVLSRIDEMKSLTRFYNAEGWLRLTRDELCCTNGCKRRAQRHRTRSDTTAVRRISSAAYGAALVADAITAATDQRSCHFATTWSTATGSTSSSAGTTWLTAAGSTAP